jgi:hypothetical protein
MALPRRLSAGRCVERVFRLLFLLFVLAQMRSEQTKPSQGEEEETFKSLGKWRNEAEIKTFRSFSFRVETVIYRMPPYKFTREAC